jgi:two-component system chemotaxis sensor kinase CheA
MTNATVWELAEDNDLNFVVLQANGRLFGLIVDSISDTEEIVVKPTSRRLQGLPMYAGATVMGDGRVALILDALGLARHARVISDKNRVAESVRHEESRAETKNLETMLLVRIGSHRRAALPISTISRLEDVKISSIEAANGSEVVQYRNKILPLFHLDSLFGEAYQPSSTNSTRAVVVFERGSELMGMVVSEVIDVLETPVAVLKSSVSPGLKGSTVINDYVTDLLDVDQILATAEANLAMK